MNVGKHGEDLAVHYFEDRGWRVLDRNYRYEGAEIDLVCFEPTEAGGEIVIVEVKARTRTDFGRPEEAVTPEKQRHVTRAARAYLHERRLENARVRFDVVSIVLRPGREPEIEHFRDAFLAEG